MIDDTLIFVDGENIFLRYQEMIKLGRKPRSDNKVIDDCFVWNSLITQKLTWNIKRLSYYTSVSGDDAKVRAIREQISNVIYKCRPDKGSTLTGQIVPFVRKKARTSRKESICDIAIAVDVMRACYRDHAPSIWIFSGDGDFIKLFEEVVHSGKKAYASALSSGLNQEIRFVIDEFIPIDEYLFEPQTQIDPTASDTSDPH
jgi:uncharacterized LabA/DUF88 family protein